MGDLLAPFSVNESPLLIFVTGLPSKSTVQVVLDHFKKYGKVQLYRISNNSSQANKVLQAHASANIKRGFCILRALNESTYQNILSSSEPFLGRTLAVGPFRQGSELWSHNEHINSRRVIVKKVPALVPEEMLRAALETQFGSIHRMYRFAAESTHKAAKKEKSRKHHSYSVEFDLESSADRAAAEGSFHLAGIHTAVLMEKFQKKPVDQVSSFKHSSQSKNYPLHKSQEDGGNTAPNRPGNFFIDEPTQPSPPSHNLRRRLAPPATSDNHEIKPTAKRYHEDRRELAWQGSQVDYLTQGVRLNISSLRGSTQTRSNPTPSTSRATANTYSLFYRAR